MSDREELAHYLSVYPPYFEYQESWPVQGPMTARIGLSPVYPPQALVSSVLTIIFDTANKVVFLYPITPTNNISHVLVGGRASGFESPKETLIREVGEELGIDVEPLQVIGYRHFFQTGVFKAISDRPYPEFIQPIFSSRLAGANPNRSIPTDSMPFELFETDRVRHILGHNLFGIIENGAEVLTKGQNNP